MLVRLVDNEATAIVPVARISSVTTAKNCWKISDSTVANKTHKLFFHEQIIVRT